jgi:hypothetical protein
MRTTTEIVISILGEEREREERIWKRKRERERDRWRLTCWAGCFKPIEHHQMPVVTAA